MAQFRLLRIERLVRPTDAQRGAFDELKAASARALEIVRAACPAETPLTPTGRLELAEKRVDARLQAIRILRPSLDAFYRTLTDEQKVRWSLGMHQGGRGAWRERWGHEHERGREGGPQALERRDERRWQDREEAGRERGRDEGRFRDGRGAEPRGAEPRGGEPRGTEPRWRDQDRWGERWRDLDRGDPRRRNEYPGRPQEERL